jgi:murein DD-endopeptidase MepM/ murein hydrolase activator NlpD
MTLRRLAAALLATLLLAASAPPAAAASASAARKRQEQLRAERAKAAAQVDALKSSDADLERAVATLAAQVKAQDAKVVAVRQSVAVAERAVAEADENIAATEQEIVGLRSAVVARAVDTYMRPTPSSFDGISGAKDLEDASRRASMLRQVANNDRDVIDELRARKEDLGIARERAEEARAVAAERRKAATAQLSALKANLADKARVEAALDARIKQVTAEVAALEQEDAALREIIKTESARAAAARAAAAAARASRSASEPAVPARASGSGMQWPIRGTVTSEFGPRWGRLHAGIDISAPNGTPIRAAKTGTVIFSGWQGGYGQAVVIDHGGGLTTLYAHQSRLASSSGQDVEAGQVIGYVGSTGNSTGNHLHFETRVDGSPQNPRRYL